MKIEMLVPKVMEIRMPEKLLQFLKGAQVSLLH